MKTNVKVKAAPVYTHEGAKAVRDTKAVELLRLVSSCYLWENQFYETGDDQFERMKVLVSQVSTTTVAAIAVYARTDMNLRHVPLAIVLCMFLTEKHKKAVSKVLPAVIQRPDEMGEFRALLIKFGITKIPHQVKKGLATALNQFSQHQLSKYANAGGINLKRCLMVAHAKPKDEQQSKIFKGILDGTLETADTWETTLSASGNTKENWERLLQEKKLGGLALLRNLRNMQEKGVSLSLIAQAIKEMKTDRILPYRFIAASKYAPALLPQLEGAMLRSIGAYEKWNGHTVLMVDVSGSMFHPLSQKSDLQRIDAACGLAIILKEMCDVVTIKTFSYKTVDVPSHRGFALSQAIVNSQYHGGTALIAAVNSITELACDRLIVLTDEQAMHDYTSINKKFAEKQYLINVASHAPSVTSDAYWMKIFGFSEKITEFISQHETGDSSSMLKYIEEKYGQLI